MKLFNRVKRRVELTIQGQRYLITLQDVFDEIESATKKLMSNPNSGAVNLSVAPAFLTRWLVPRIHKFQTQYPDTELRLTAALGQTAFEHSDMDMAVYFGDGNWPDLEIHHLRNVITVPICSPRLLESAPPISKPEDLLNFTLIQVSKRGQEWKQLLQRYGIGRVDRAKNLTFSNTSLALGAAMEGLGIALADKGLAERELEYGQLISPLDLELDTGNAFYLVYQKNSPLTQNMCDFRDWILREMGD